MLNRKCNQITYESSRNYMIQCLVKQKTYMIQSETETA